MSFHKTSIHNCPHALNTAGVAIIDTEVIRELAGAVWDHDEWLVVFRGTREEDRGLIVQISDIVVPRNQVRTVGNCSIKDYVIKDGVVGVAHSHHSMRAFFSTGDIEDFNMKFFFSMVIAQPAHNDSDEFLALGFQYKAEGRYRLPCGSLGRSEFFIRPDIDDWPWKHEAHRGQTANFQTLGLCDRKTETEESDNYYAQFQSECGLIEPKKSLRKAVFGRGTGIVPLLPKPTIIEPKKDKLKGGSARWYDKENEEWREWQYSD